MCDHFTTVTVSFPEQQTLEDGWIAYVCRKGGRQTGREGRSFVLICFGLSFGWWELNSGPHACCTTEPWPSPREKFVVRNWPAGLQSLIISKNIGQPASAPVELLPYQL